MKMTLDEAIAHCLEVAEQNETKALRIGRQYKGTLLNRDAIECRECAADRRQLAEWLTELKDLREENKVLTSECDRLIKEKGELLSKVGGGDVLRICQLEEQIKDWKEEYANLNKISYGFYEELKEAKRLLKLAVEDMGEENFCAKVCKRDKFACQVSDTCDFKWRYADEALKLIGEDGDTNG